MSDLEKVQRFYQPILHEVEGLPLVTYVSRRESPEAVGLSRRNRGCIEQFVGRIVAANNGILVDSNYGLAFVRAFMEESFLTVWTIDGPVGDGDSYFVGSMFRGSDATEHEGPGITTSGDELTVLGHEAGLHRTYPGEYASLSGRHDSLPLYCRADEPYYTREAL